MFTQLVSYVRVIWLETDYVDSAGGIQNKYHTTWILPGYHPDMSVSRGELSAGRRSSLCRFPAVGVQQFNPIYIYIYNIYIHIHTYIYAYVYIYIYMCIYITYIYIYIYMYVYM